MDVGSVRSDAFTDLQVERDLILFVPVPHVSILEVYTYEAKPRRQAES